MAQDHTKAEGDGLPPGTSRLIDVDGSVIGQHASGSGENDIVLIPRPSEDPEDPLNWTRKRKLLATSCVVLYTIMIAIPSSAVYSVVTPIRKATGLSLADINNGTGIMVSMDVQFQETFSDNNCFSFSSTAGDASSGNLLLSNMASDLPTWLPLRRIL